MHGFKPFGVTVQANEHLALLFEEWEAIRLLDHIGLNQAEAAEHLNVSRPTLTRIYEKARKTIAKSLVEGIPFFIEGGEVEFTDHWMICESCFKRFQRNEGKHICPECESSKVKPVIETIPEPQVKNVAEDYCKCPKKDKESCRQKDCQCFDRRNVEV